MLEVTVSDDGCGGAQESRGGLRGIANRITALSGTLAVHSAGVRA